MKKMAVIVMVVLFSFVGVAYAVEETNMAGPLKSLVLKVTYEEEIGYNSQTMSEGRNFVTVTPGIGKAITGGLNSDPVLYVIGGGSQIYISWISPNSNPPNSGQRIWTINCPLGVISMKPQVSLTKPPPTKSTSIKGMGACTICPDGIGFSTANDPTTTPTGLCNGGGSYGIGYVTFAGTDNKSLETGSSPPNYNTTSVLITATVAGSAFNYVGEDWACKDGTQYNDWSTFPAIFTGTFSAKVTPCTTDPSCVTQY